MHWLKYLDRSDLRLVITGTSRNVHGFVKLAKDRGVDRYVHFTGHVDHATKLPRIYAAAADVVVIPSPCREATAIAMLEGIAIRKPMVVAHIGGLTEVAKDIYNALVRPAEVRAFGDAISLLLGGSKLAQRLVRNAFEFPTQDDSMGLGESRVVECFSKRKDGRC